MCWSYEKDDWVWCQGGVPIGSKIANLNTGKVNPCSDFNSIKFDDPMPTAGLAISSQSPYLASGKTSMQAGFSYDFQFTYIIPKCCLTSANLMPPPGGGPDVYWFVGDSTIIDPNNLGITVAPYPVLFLSPATVTPFTFSSSFTINIPANVPLNLAFPVTINFFIYPFGGLTGQCRRTVTVNMHVRFF